MGTESSPRHIMLSLPPAFHTLSARLSYDRIKAISRSWVKIGLATATLVTIYLTLSLIDSPVPSIAWPMSTVQERHAKEAYALYLPASNLPGYFEDGVLLTLFGLMVDPELRDPHHRDVVVIVTNQTDPDQVLQIRDTGAKVFHAPYELEHLMPFRETWHEAWRHTFDKLWLWALTDYERVLYLDADTIFNKPIWPVWDEPEARAESGFASAEDGHMGDRPGYFNSGFMLLRPNMTTFEEIIHWEISDDDPMIFPDQVCA